jgi:hypothetical protein
VATIDGQNKTATVTAPSVVPGSSRPWQGAFMVVYADTGTGFKDKIEVVVNSSTCRDNPPAVPDPGNDQGCGTGSGFPSLQFSSAAQFYKWPGELLGYLAKILIWLVIPPACATDKLKSDLDEFGRKGIFSVIPEMKQAINTASACTGDSSDTFHFYTLADFAGGCTNTGEYLNTPGVSASSRTITAPIRVASLELSGLLNAQLRLADADSYSLDPTYGTGAVIPAFPKTLDLSKWHGILVMLRIIMGMVAWVDFFMRMFRLAVMKAGAYVPETNRGGGGGGGSYAAGLKKSWEAVD